jgi:hypothetical protein
MAEVKANDLADNENVFDARVGADPVEEAETLDLNFMDEEEEAPAETVAETEEAVEEPEVEEETVAETEEAEETTEEPETEEETVAETEEAVEEPEVEEPVAETEPEPEPKKIMVPKERLDAVLAKQKALQKQLEEMQSQQNVEAAAPEPYDYDAKETQYQEFVLEGETAKAAALRKEIRAAEKAEMQYEFEKKMGLTVQESHQANALQQAAAELEANFPMFNQNHEAFDTEATQEVVDLRDAFITQGFTPVDALAKASSFVIKDRGVVDQAPESALSAPKAKPAVDEVAKKRANNAKKLKAAEAQPPELPGESSSAHGEKPESDFSNMTEEEFNALPEATLKRMRGDIL